MAIYYSHINKHLTNNDHIIIEREVVRAFRRGLGPRERVVGNTFRVASVHMLGVLVKKVKAYIDLE